MQLRFFEGQKLFFMIHNVQQNKGVAHNEICNKCSQKYLPVHRQKPNATVWQ